MSFALCEFEFRVFYWQRCSDVYFTYSGLLIMHYSKRYKNCHSQGKGTECVFLIISDFCIHVHTQYNKALFFHENAINCPLPFNIFFYWML